MSLVSCSQSNRNVKKYLYLPVTCLGEPRQKKTRLAKTEAEKELFREPQTSVTDDDLTYICGWLIKDQIQCPHCKGYLSTEERGSFLKWKAYSKASQDSLTAPSRDIMRHIITWDKMFRKNILKIVHRKNLSHALVQKFSAHPLPSFCPTHFSLCCSLPLRFAVFRLHAYCKFKNFDLKDARCLTKTKLTRLNAL